MFNRVVHKLQTIRLTHLIWISLLLSEIFTAAMNTVLGLIWWGRIDRDLLLIGAVDALFVAFGVTVIIMFIIRMMKDYEKTIAASLEKTNSQLTALINTIPDMVIFKDVAGRHVIVNKAVEEVTGHPDCEIVGKTIEDMLPPDSAVACRKSDEGAMARTLPTHAEERITRQDGSILFFDMVKAPMVDDRGNVIGLVAVGRDITENKKMERALRESEEKFRTLFESANDAIFILDLEGNFIDFNKTAYERLGYMREEMVSMQLSQLDQPPYAKKAQSRIEQVIKDGYAVFESAHRKKDGGSMPVEINCRLIEFGSKKVLYSIVRDISERKRAADALAKTARELKEAQRLAKIGSWELDLPTGVLTWSDEIYRIFEIAPDKFGASYEAFLLAIHPDDREAVDTAYTNSLKTRAPYAIDHRLLFPDGRIKYVHEECETVFDNEVPTRSQGIVQDVTERTLVEEELRKHREQLLVLVDERTEELKQANYQLRREIAERERMEADLVRAQKLESVGILAGGIAHDFNNLLTTILGNISLSLVDLGSNHPAYKQLISAERASLRAQDLTQQILTFSKGGEPIKKTISIGDIVGESVEFSLRGSRTRCELSVSDHLWPVEADEGQMSQVIQNLVINADQAMPDGGTIAVRCENSVLSAGDTTLLAPGKYVKIAVRDTGVGIPKEHLSKIFDPYFTTKQRGSGLGLATTYAIVRKHGGSIAVESEPGAGTTFTVLLPASRADLAVKRQMNEGLLRGIGKILIMDDEEEVRKTTGDALVRLGYSVVFADGGAQTIDLYRNAMEAGSRFDAVIMDLTIPGGMGGKEAITHLLAIDPAVKAIVSSGYSNDSIMANYKSYGFSGVVTKPYRLKQLAEVVHRVIAGGM